MRKKEKPPTGSNDDQTSAIERLIEDKAWARARLLINEELIFQPADHWLWMTLGLTYYEEKEYAKALKCSERAVQLAPDCPLALWHYAGSLFMSGRQSAALAIWNLLLNQDLEKVAYSEHGEGMDWAMQLLNDVQYRIGRYHEWKGDAESARRSFEKCLHNRKRGVSSIYNAAEVEQYVTETSN
jgi:tetratricopeptide (TPR) repeat protein